MGLIMCALGEALDFLESKGMTREEAARKIVEYVLLNYLGTHYESEE